MSRGHLSLGPKLHPRGYAMPKGRKPDGTMLVRVHGPSNPPERVPMPEWLVAGPVVRAAKVHPLSYHMPKGRKPDGTMLWRAPGALLPVRIPIPNNFRIVAATAAEPNTAAREAA